MSATGGILTSVVFGVLIAIGTCCVMLWCCLIVALIRQRFLAWRRTHNQQSHGTLHQAASNPQAIRHGGSIGNLHNQSDGVQNHGCGFTYVTIHGTTDNRHGLFSSANVYGVYDDLHGPFTLSILEPNPITCHGLEQNTAHVPDSNPNNIANLTQPYEYPVDQPHIKIQLISRCETCKTALFNTG